MKHKHITFATRNVPGYNAPSAPASRKGGGYPLKPTKRMLRVARARMT